MKTISLRSRGVLIVLVPLALQFIFVIGIINLLLNVQSELEAGAKIRNLHFQLNQFQWHTMDEFLFFGGVDSRSMDDKRFIAQSLRDQMKKFSDEELTVISKEYISRAQIAAFNLSVENLLKVINWSAVKLTTDPGQLTANRDEAFRRSFAVLPPFLAEMQRLTDAHDAAVDRSIKKSRILTDSIFCLVGMSIPISFVVGVVLGCFFSFSIKKPITHLAENSRRLSKGEPLLPVLVDDAALKTVDELLHEIALALATAKEDEKALVENAADLVCWLDFDGTFVQVNASAERILGLPKDELIGMRLNEITTPEDSLLADEFIRKTIISQEAQSFMLKLRRSGNFVIDTNWSTFWSPMQEKLFCVVRDVTEEEELARMKKGFVDMISHDLRSPLTSLGITLEIITGGFEDLPAAARREVEEDKKTVDSLIGFINDLLDYQKLGEGRVELNKTALSSSKLIEKVLELAVVKAEKRDIKFEVPDRDFTILADSQQLQQVFSKLLSNSIRTSPDGSLIAVSAEKDNNLARFSVSNPGFEIAESVRNKIFDPYEQESSSLNQNGGLALAVCKMIIEAHGGEIGVCDLPGERGSRIWFTIESAGG